MSIFVITTGSTLSQRLFDVNKLHARVVSLIPFILFTVDGLEAQEILFSEDFNDYPYQLEWEGDEVWSVLNGTVDVIGDGTPYELLEAGSGRYIDLDGYGDPADFSNRQRILFSHPNTYVLQFDLAGNQGATPSIPSSDTDTVKVTLSGTMEEFVVPKDQPLENYFVSAHGKDQWLSFYFKNSADGDRQGALLDNVTLSVYPTININSCHSGSWFWEEQNGHGFSIEIGKLPSGEPWAAVYWYTYSVGGWPMFLVGIGTPEKNMVDLEFVSPAGMSFGEFDPETVDLLEAGTGHITFLSENEAMFRYSPSDISKNLWGHRPVNNMPLEKLFDIYQPVCGEVQ